MKYLSIIFLILLCNCCFAKNSPKIELFDDPIEFKIETTTSLNAFSEKIKENIDIEKFIKHQIKNEYIPVSLDECLDVALENNFDIQIKNHEYKSAKYAYQNKLTNFLPVFNTTSYVAKYAGQILVGGVLSDDFDETAISVNLTVQHNLTRGGKDIFEAKAAKYFSKSKEHISNFTKTEVLFYTSKYYYEMLLAKINIEIYLRNLIERNAQLALAQSLKNSGFGTNFDIIRSKNELQDAKDKLYNALNNFRISESKLANIMGIKNETPLIPIESEVVELNLIDNNLTQENIFDIALNNREDLKSYLDLIRYEKQMKNVIKTDFIPKPLINFQQQFQGTARTSIYPNYIIAGYVTWEPGQNIALGTITKLREQSEKIKVKKLELENKYREIKENLINANSTSQFNKKQIAINKKRVDYTNESIKLAMLRFNHGKGILLDIIQAQNEKTNARVQYVTSIINYNLSQLDLLFNMGTISKEKIIENYKP